MRRSPAPQTHAGSPCVRPCVRRPQPPTSAARSGSGYSFQEGASPGTARCSSLGDHGTAGCALALGALGPHLPHLVPAVGRRTGRQPARPASLGLPALPEPAPRWRALELGARALQRGAVLRLRCRPGWDRWRGAGVEAAPRGELGAGGVRSARSLSPASWGRVPASRPRRGPASSGAASGRGGGA